MSIELYKYCTYSANSLGVLINSEVWYCKPAEFNDPFDGDYSVSEECTAEEFISMFNLDCTPNDFKSLNPEYFDENDLLSKEKYNKFSDVVKGLKNIGVLCLTSKRDSVLMWSHYADEHRGFNLKLKLHEDIPYQNISYNNTLPVKKLSYFYEIVTNNEGYIDIQFYKHIDWEYEDEYRICINGGNRLVKLPGEITEINFGCKMPDNYKKTISNLIKGANIEKPIDLYSAVKADNLSLDFEKYI